MLMLIIMLYALCFMLYANIYAYAYAYELINYKINSTRLFNISDLASESYQNKYKFLATLIFNFRF